MRTLTHEPNSGRVSRFEVRGFSASILERLSRFMVHCPILETMNRFFEHSNMQEVLCLEESSITCFRE